MKFSRSPLSWAGRFPVLSAWGLWGSPFPALMLMATNCHVVMESGTFTRMLWWEVLLEGAGQGASLSWCFGTEPPSSSYDHSEGLADQPVRGITSRGSSFWGSHWDLCFHPGRLLS